MFPKFCLFLEGILITDDPSLDDPARYEAFMGHFPGTMSVQNLLHYLQLMRSVDMKLYDFGSSELNIQHYGKPTPPEVDLM